MDQNFFQNTFDNILFDKEMTPENQDFAFQAADNPFIMDMDDKSTYNSNFLHSIHNNEYDSEEFVDPVMREISCGISQSGHSGYSGYSTISSDENEKETKIMEKRKRKMKRELAKSRKISKVESEKLDSMDIDPKEQKRIQQMLKNRISAQASRDRKKMYMSNMESKNARLEALNSQYEARLKRLEEENKNLQMRLDNCTCENNNTFSPTFMKFGLSLFTLVSVFLIINTRSQDSSRHLISEAQMPSNETSSLLKLPFTEMKALDYSPISDTVKEARRYLENTLPMEIMPQTNAIVPIQQPRKIVRAGKKKALVKDKGMDKSLTTILCPRSYYMQDNMIMKKLKIEGKEEEYLFL